LSTGVVKKQQKSKMTEHGENNMEISQEGISLIKKFEGCKLESYQCAAGVWTIGYGSTHGVSQGMVITHERAESLLMEDIEVYEEEVNKAVQVDIDQCMFDSIVSWTFNLGGANLNSSTMLKVLNSKDFDNVPEQIKRWNKAGGKVNEGLIRRREAEALLFQGQDWSHV
jgi:lysozyme